MKLLNQLTLIYLALTLITLVIGGFFIFRKLESEINFELGMELKRQIDAFSVRLQQGATPEGLASDRLQIIELPAELPVEPLTLRDTLAYHDPMNQQEIQLKASQSYKIGDKHYRISYYNLVVETEDITETVVYTMLIVLFVQLLFIGLFFRGLSNRMLSPFYHTLNQIQQFSFQQNEPLRLGRSTIKEFDELNGFLERMSNKLLKDYRQIKEFSENISHEIQTPAAVVRGKLEHLMNLDISYDQAELIHAAYQNNERIHRIVKSLSLLAKLENEEFGAPTPINLTEILKRNLETLEELIHLSELTLETDLSKQVMVTMHPFIAEIMMHNLVSNAIKHNRRGGWIRVALTADRLEITNSGSPLRQQPQELMQRFKKESRHADSVGLGLAIVSQICKTYRFKFSYAFQHETHTAIIDF
jgi:signal transduction histidine kinase